ncbi:membrane-associated phospholipid phosphatase [Streptomyces achromogenes]|uniref:phosphatase PAP2 family protein n=1 Tax=Streptomyces achromogenes TaxID=67255 RepID=UPI0027818CE1|nr:phosphatase PAP2 family protein [Streptomyces achromogenes]MDQ0833960.1 membrane-associated phospholipid phosphatase [Streptomyces achromogenes]
MNGRSAHAALPPSLRSSLGPIAGLAALVVLALGVLYAGDGEPGRVDRWVVRPTADSVRPPWRNVALALDFLGEPVGAAMLLVAVVAGCLLLRRPRTAVLAVAGAGLTVGAATLLKSVVGRTIHGDDNLSYPSGHTAFATALALVVALLAVGRLGLARTAGTSLALTAALVAGASMGWAQVALGAHYPTDVLGGWCAALTVVPATAWLIDRWADRLEGRLEGRSADGSADPVVTPPTGPIAGPPADAGRQERR